MEGMNYGGGSPLEWSRWWLCLMKNVPLSEVTPLTELIGFDLRNVAVPSTGGRTGGACMYRCPINPMEPTFGLWLILLHLR